MFKKIFFIITMIYLSLFASDNCWKIKNSDTKVLCESKFEGKNNCWAIKNSDMRAYCEASVEGKSSCWKIKENDYKEMCIAETK